MTKGQRINKSGIKCQVKKPCNNILVDGDNTNEAQTVVYETLTRCGSGFTGAE